MQVTPPLKNLAIAQLCFVTDDLEGSVATFSRLTGLTPGPISTAAEPGTPTYHHGTASAVRARTQAFKLPNIEVEFLQPGPEPSAWRDTLTTRGPALHHIAFRTDRVAGDRTSFQEQGIGCLQHADFVGGGGLYAVFDTAKAIGTLVETFELRPTQPS